MKTSARQIRTAGGGIGGAAAVLRQEMNTLVAALRSADLSPSGWLTPGQIAVMLRSAYDPAIAATLERHGRLGQSLATAGPVAVTETWGKLRTDSASPRRALGQQSGRGRWCIRGSCRRCCCPPASSGLSR
jgi:hypothetical protein